MKRLILIIFLLIHTYAYSFEPIFGESSIKGTLDKNPNLKEELFDLCIRDILKKETKNLNGNSEEFIKKILSRFSESNLPGFIKSYSIKNLSRSVEDPSITFMRIDASVDRALFSQYYQQLLQLKPEDLKNQYYLKTSFELDGVIWNDLGVSSQDDFVKVVNDHWIKWLKESSPLYKNISIYQGQSEGVVLDVSMKIKKGFFESHIISGMMLDYSGLVYVKNISNGKIIFGKRFTPKNNFYSLDLKTGLSSAIANHVYRVPLDTLNLLKDESTHHHNSNSTQLISLHHYTRTEDVFSFMDKLKEQLATINADVSVNQFTTNQIIINLTYEGSPDKLKGLLATVNFESFKPSPQNPYEFYFVNTPEVNKNHE